MIYHIPAGTEVWRAVKMDPAKPDLPWASVVGTKGVTYDETEIVLPPMQNSYYYFRLPKTALPFRFLAVPQADVQVLNSIADIRKYK